MKRLALVLTTAAALTGVAAAPAQARGWHHHGFFGPGLAFGLAAGALAAGAAAASPYYYDYPYYGGYYYGGPYAYYGGPVYYGPRFYRRHHWHHW